MTSFSRTLHRLFPLIALPLLAAPLPAGAAAVRHAKAPATAVKPAAANNAIIALPLQPIVPATQRVCTARTPNGLGYTMLRPGSGPKPTADATVLISYVGYLAATGAVFDQNTQTPMPVGQVIPGFSQGLQLLGKTGIVRLCIPAAMGYGAQASGPIPANSDLVFQVELLDFKSAAEIAEMRKARAAEEAAPKEDGAPKEGADPKAVPPQR
jgi:FKBP-type peptidyl-prolyl cis-trans isomerase FkpA